MKKPSSPGALALRSGFVAAFALFAVSACSTKLETPPEPVNPDAVDVGYGSTDKDHVTGSVATIRNDESGNKIYRTIGEMIRDKVPGVVVQEQANGVLRVRIRGNNSIIAGQDPLFVLDGMALQSSAALVGISPSVVESVTVLKDAGSTAIYGSRGANGVILIKTKRGSHGGGGG